MTQSFYHTFNLFLVSFFFLELTKKEFDEDCNRLCALTSNETLEEEHKYYEQR
jgi:hypothetical protein